MGLLEGYAVRKLLQKLDGNRDDARIFYHIATRLGYEGGFGLAWVAVRWCIEHGTPTEERVREALKL